MNHGVESKEELQEVKAWYTVGTDGLSCGHRDDHDCEIIAYFPPAHLQVPLWFHISDNILNVWPTTGQI